jgi:hypothetical protein
MVKRVPRRSTMQVVLGGRQCEEEKQSGQVEGLADFGGVEAFIAGLVECRDGCSGRPESS